MSVPNEPIPDQPPMPAPGWKPVPPITEPEPDRLPDEAPVPNPDENDEPARHVGSKGRSAVRRQRVPAGNRRRS
ncbi:hypothetical protein [Rhizobium leguminosarum]|uniref:hypothetical protein n=1 Tax=Rhizobium leguminosarum TaxID=384 RepID=UPI001FEDD592|nr:hypothetical protein [Rhizobium leguminosarum]